MFFATATRDRPEIDQRSIRNRPEINRKSIRNRSEFTELEIGIYGTRNRKSVRIYGNPSGIHSCFTPGALASSEQKRNAPPLHQPHGQGSSPQTEWGLHPLGQRPLGGPRKEIDQRSTRNCNEKTMARVTGSQGCGGLRRVAATASQLQPAGQPAKQPTDNPRSALRAPRSALCAPRAPRSALRAPRSARPALRAPR